MTEIAKRKPILQSTLKTLCSKAGNMCSYEGCVSLLIQNNVFVGDIGHIHGVEKGSARFNSCLDEEQLRAEKNLILLCKTHHYIIDHRSLETEYPAERVRRMKADHEKSISKALDAFFFGNSIKDELDTSKIILGRNYARLINESDFKNDSEIKEFKTKLANFGNVLRKLPKKHREFIYAVLRRTSERSMNVNFADLKDALDIDSGELNSIFSTLEDKLLISSEPNERPPYVYLLDKGFGLEGGTLEQLRSEFTDEELKEIFIDLNFAVMDDRR